MMQYKKGMMIIAQDEQTTGRQAAQKRVVLYGDADKEVQQQEKRVRRYQRGMMIIARLKDE